MKILLIRFSSIGDIVLTTPVMRCIKTQVPEAELHVLSKAGFKTVLASNPYIDKLLLLDKEQSITAVARQVRAEKYDVIIDLHSNLRTSIIKGWQLFSKTRIASFDKLNFKKWLLVTFKINRMPDVHIVDRYLAPAVKLLGIHNDNKGLNYFIPATDIIDIKELPEVFHTGYNAYAIGGQHNTKKAPLHKMRELCEASALPLILLGGKEDAEAGTALEGMLNSNGLIKVISLCGKLNLNQSASVLKQSQRVYTHDTGLMHIAAALHKPISSIWGNTVPEFGMYPYEPNAELAALNFIHEVKGLNCRPCSKIGFKTCPRGHFKCMEMQEFN